MDKNLYLCYVRLIPSQHHEKEDYMFYFTDNIVDVVGEYWDEIGISTPPINEYIVKRKLLSGENLTMELLSNNEYYTYYDGADGIIALAWEYSENTYPTNGKRLVFKFGERLSEVEDKLFEREIGFYS